MIESYPIPGHPHEMPTDGNTVTVELSPDEVNAALAAYVGGKRGDNFTGYGFPQFEVDKKTQMLKFARYTYWRIPVNEVVAGIMALHGAMTIRAQP